MNLNENDVALLKQTVDATNSNSFLYATVEMMANLQAANFVEGNPQMAHPDNAAAFAYRARPEGLVYVQNLAAAASQPVPAFLATAPAAAPVAAPATPAAVPAASGPTIIRGFVPPAKTTRRPTANPNSKLYPFETMEIGEAHFVAATEKRPDPKKSLASTISAANRRYQDFVPQRYFRTYRVSVGQKCGDFVAPSNGVMIVRTEPPVAEEVAQ